jgi:hypothetical protein
MTFLRAYLAALLLMALFGAAGIGCDRALDGARTKESPALVVPIELDGSGRIIMEHDTLRITVSRPDARVFLLPFQVKLYPVSGDYLGALFSVDSVHIYQDGHAYRLLDDVEARRTK